jgi:hypothetical protein
MAAITVWLGMSDCERDGLVRNMLGEIVRLLGLVQNLGGPAARPRSSPRMPGLRGDGNRALAGQRLAHR